MKGDTKMVTMQSTGQYSKKDGTTVSYEYEYVVYDGSEDMATILALANRQAKVDGNNKTREAVKAKNGDSVRPVLSETEKAVRKEDSKKVRDLAKLIKAKGLSMEDLKGLLG